MTLRLAVVFAAAAMLAVLVGQPLAACLWGLVAACSALLAWWQGKETG